MIIQMLIVIQPYYQPSPAPPTPFCINSAYCDPSIPAGNQAAWAMNVAKSTDIIIFGAGFYSFFHVSTMDVYTIKRISDRDRVSQNYTQTCLIDSSCQNQLFNVDSHSKIHAYSVSTVGATYQLSVSSVGVINQSDNPNGFASTFTSWSP